MYGDYDKLATPISIIIQSVGALGFLLSLPAIIWLLVPTKNRLFAFISLYLGFFLAIFFSILAYFTAGILPGITILFFWVLLFIKLRKKVTKAVGKEINNTPSVPIYLISVPIFVLVIQLIIAKPVTNWSRDRTIINATEFIKDIESFKSKNGYYPKTLQAMYKDYSPKTAGVEKYHYLPFTDSYNISFEQPRFLFDEIGTREWVVYHPKDEHRAYSHTSWLLLLSPEESELRQGWYTSVNTGHKHWKSFLFD